jgi:hypothetical protein
LKDVKTQEFISIALTFFVHTEVVAGNEFWKADEEGGMIFVQVPSFFQVT